MKDNLFQSYSKRHVQFYVRDVPELLEAALTLVNNSTNRFSLLDLGCGDGGLIFGLYGKGLLKNAQEITGVDISRDRIERLRVNLPFVKGIVADALYLRQLRDSSFDFVVCAQLIEHVQDEQRLMSEIARLLKPSGLTYVSSVIKKPWGIYLYFKNGSFRLDPTHIREYSSAEEFIDSVTHWGLEIVKVQTHPLSFPLLDLAVRLSIRIGLAEPDVAYYEKHRNLSTLRNLRLAVMGYEIAEAILTKLSGKASGSV